MSNTRNQRQYRIGEVARRLDESAITIRYWESEFGITPLRSKSGQRVYTAGMLGRLARIRYLIRDMGMTIAGARRMERHAASLERELGA